MTSAPAVDGPDGTDVAPDPDPDPDPLAALVPEPTPLPVVSILQPARASVAVTSTVAADRAETEASTRRGSIRGSLSGGRPGRSRVARAIPVTRKVSRFRALRLRNGLQLGHDHPGRPG